MSPEELSRYVGQNREVVLRNGTSLNGIVGQGDGRWWVEREEIQPDDVVEVRASTIRPSFALEWPLVPADVDDPPGMHRLDVSDSRTATDQDWTRMEAASEIWRYVESPSPDHLRVIVKTSAAGVKVTAYGTDTVLVSASKTGWIVVQEEPLVLRLDVPRRQYFFTSVPAFGPEKRPIIEDGRFVYDED